MEKSGIAENTIVLYLSDHLSEWPLFFNPAPRSFLKNNLFMRRTGPNSLYTKSNVRFGTQRSQVQILSHRLFYARKSLNLCGFWAFLFFRH